MKKQIAVFEGPGIMQAKQIFFPECGRVAFETIELPEVGDSQVMVETISSVISPGTELAFLHGLDNTPREFPTRIAYCSCGRVVKKGAAVKDLKGGQRVAYEGLHATALVMEAEKCVAVPEGVDSADAACFSPIAIAMQAVRKAQVNLGDLAAVLGLGLIGNVCGQLVRLGGALDVVGIDPLSRRTEVATSCGYDYVAAGVEEALKKTKFKDGFNVVIEASGAPAAVPQAFEAAKLFGTVVLAGSTRGLTENVNFYSLLHKKGLTVIGAHNFRRPKVDDIFRVKTMKTDLRLALELLARKKVTVAPMLTEKVAAEKAPAAYKQLWENKDKLLTVVLQWGKDD